MIPVGRAGPAVILAEAAHRRAVRAALASFAIELNRDRFDRSPLTEQLTIWHRRFSAALDLPDDVASIVEEYVALLLNDIRVPEENYRMLQPIVDLLQRLRVPIPRQFERPSPAQLRAARVEEIRAQQARLRPAPPPPPADLEFDARLEELMGGARALAVRLEEHDGQLRAQEAAIRQRIVARNEEIGVLRERIHHLQHQQNEAAGDIARVTVRTAALERDVAETKQALKDKQKESFGGVLCALVTVAACIAINIAYPNLLFTPNGLTLIL